MIIKSQFTALVERLTQMFKHPERYGVSLSAQGILVTEVLESLVGGDEWDWLTRDVLVDAAYRSDLFEVADRYLRDVQDQENREVPLTIQSIPYSGYLYFPDARAPATTLSEQGFIEIFPERLWEQMLEERRNESQADIRRFYTTFERAVTVGWSLSGDLKSVDVRSTTTGLLGPDVMIGSLNDNVWLVKGISIDSLQVQAATSEQERIREVQIHIWLKETLYLEDPGMQSGAALNLYKVLPQLDVESLLLTFIEDPDPDVRINVLTALGMPAYKVGFAPGAPLPPRAERIEHVTIQPNTLMKMLAVMKSETNQGVLDNFVCAISSQSFEGKLRPYAAQIHASISELLSRLKSKQSVRDCQEILSALPIEDLDD